LAIRGAPQLLARPSHSLGRPRRRAPRGDYGGASRFRGPEPRRVGSPAHASRADGGAVNPPSLTRLARPRPARLLRLRVFGLLVAHPPSLPWSPGDRGQFRLENGAPDLLVQPLCVAAQRGGPAQLRDR